MFPPKQQTALKITPDGRIAAVVTSIPTLQDGEVLVHVKSIALNPFDAKSAEMSPTPGATIGCDFAGDIVTAGLDTNGFTIGDRVSGCVFGNNPSRLDNGAFAEYVAVPADLLFKIPSDMSYNEAATLGVGLATVGMSLYHCLKLSMVPESSLKGTRPYVLVYGGSTATGTLAIQILARSGYSPIATCSPHNFALVKTLGAAAAFDYHSPTCGPQIRDFSQGQLTYALDCITDTRSMAICYEAIGPSGGRYLSLDPFPIRGHTRRSVKPNWVLSLTIYNQPIPWKRPFKRDACPQDRKFAARWFQIAQKIIDQGQIKPHTLELRAGGWDRVSEGLDLLQRGEVSGKKLVYEVASH